MSGGTDVCTGFVGHAPLLPIRTGIISGPALGAKVEAFDDHGKPVIGEVGELVITEPMPSMPVFFWNDADGTRYRESYFADYPGVWRHGDWIEMRTDGSCVIYGRSDATLNRGGVRMGTSEFYRVVEAFPEVADSLVVDTGRLGADGRLVLFVQLAPGQELTDDLAGADQERAAPAAFAPARPRRAARGPRGAENAVRQEARGPGAEDPARHPRGAGSRSERPGKSGCARFVHSWA